MKQERYKIRDDKDLIDEWEERYSIEDFRKIIWAIMERYGRRVGLKDDPVQGVAKIADYANRWLEIEKRKSEEF